MSSSRVAQAQTQLAFGAQSEAKFEQKSSGRALSEHPAPQYSMFGDDSATGEDATGSSQQNQTRNWRRSLRIDTDEANEGAPLFGMEQLSQSLASFLLDPNEEARPTDATVDSIGSGLDSEFSFENGSYFTHNDPLWSAPAADGSVFGEAKEEAGRGLGSLLNQLYGGPQSETSPTGGLAFPGAAEPQHPPLPLGLKAISPRSQQQHHQQLQYAAHHTAPGAASSLMIGKRSPTATSSTHDNSPKSVDSGSTARLSSDVSTPPDPVLVQVVTVCQAILKDAAKKSLKAVELANTLRARVGTDVLAQIREKYGGLLSLLELYPNIFCVDRIPKNDSVSLVDKSGGMGGGVALPRSPTAMESPTGVGTAQGQASNEFVSRCLHIGNVPATLGEAELRREFERYGTVEYLKVVNQRGRRYAFVNFATIEEAIRAKQRLSRLHPWKSAISFARKDMRHHTRGNSNASIGSIDDTSSQTSHESSRSASAGSVHSHLHIPANAFLLDRGDGARWSPSPSSPSFRTSVTFQIPTTSVQHIRSHSLQSTELRALAWERQIHHGMAPAPDGSHHRRSLTADHPLMANSNVRLMDLMVQPPSPVAYVQVPVQWPVDSAGHVYAPVSMAPVPQPQGQGPMPQMGAPPMMTHLSQPMYAPAAAAAAAAAPPGTYSMCDSDPRQMHSHNTSPSPVYVPEPGCPVLERLTDDTYVPTQLWPIDEIADVPYIRAIEAQLRQLNGSTTVSKLRGFLRNRVSSSKNIKSVPLKALLNAYPNLFVVQNNQVTLRSLSPM